MLNLSVILEATAAASPSTPAFTFGDTTMTYAQVNGAANQVANGLISKGILPGDKVALSCLNLPYFPIAYFGILKAGATVVPLSVLLKKDEIAYHLSDSDAKAYFCFIGTPDLPMLEMGHSGFSEVTGCEYLFAITAQPTDASPIEGIPTMGSLMSGQSPILESSMTGADDIAVIIYTSGTTGRPKGAELSHSNLFCNAVLAADLFKASKDDVMLCVLPLFHIFAMTCLMNAGIYRGAHIILLPRFEAEDIFGLMLKHEVTIFAGVPTMYWGLNSYEDSKFDYETISKNLRLAASGGASLPLAVLEKFEKRFNVPILEGYGMSEGSPIVTFNRTDIPRKPGSVGKEVWGVSVKVVDDEGNQVPVGERGELIYKGHNVTKGYYNKPEANAKTIKNGWLYSGDVAIKDEDGYYFIVDRTKDMIIRGGLNVYPREVEETMMKHPEVSLVAVIGIPDDKMGEEIKAYVVLNDNATITVEELREWTKGNLAAYKYPRQIEILDSLPMSATGKILKKELRKR